MQRRLGAHKRSHFVGSRTLTWAETINTPTWSCLWGVFWCFTSLKQTRSYAVKFIQPVMRSVFLKGKIASRILLALTFRKIVLMHNSLCEVTNAISNSWPHLQHCFGPRNWERLTILIEWRKNYESLIFFSFLIITLSNTYQCSTHFQQCLG